MVEQGPWSMVHRDIEIERRKQRRVLQRKSHVDGWHCPEKEGCSRRVFQTFEDESSSILAKIVISFVMFLIFLSTVAYVLETIPDLTKYLIDNNFQNLFIYIESFVSVCFTVEYLVRILSCRNSWIFFWDPMSIIDLLAILPFQIELFFDVGDQAQILKVLRVVRLVRIFRLLKSKQLKEYLDVITQAVAKSTPSCGLLATIFILFIIVFSSLMYTFEKGSKDKSDWAPMSGDDVNSLYIPFYTDTKHAENRPSKYRHILDAIWWCVVTITCVGYGDVRPETPLGKITGIFTMSVGLFVIAVPVIIIGQNFDMKR